MNKSELIAVTAESTGLTKKDAERVLNAALDAITEAMTDHEKVQLSGFGTFEIKFREAGWAAIPRPKSPPTSPPPGSPPSSPAGPCGSWWAEKRSKPCDWTNI